MALPGLRPTPEYMGALTAIAFLIAFAFRPQGFAVLLGLAVFQLLMMGAATGAMARQLRG